MQVLLHHVDKLDAADLPCSSLQGVGEEGEKAFPPQSTPAKPTDTDLRHAEVAPKGLCSSLGTTPDIAVTDDPHCEYGREINECNKCFK